MKKYLALLLFGFMLALLVTSCGAIPGLTFTSTDTPQPPPTENLMTPSATIPPPPTEVPTATITPSITPTASLTPTPKIYAPAGPGTPMVDMGFPLITFDNVPQLTPVFQAMKAEVRTSVASGDGEKLFVSTSNGLFVFNKAGEQLAYWGDIFTFDIPCKQCLSVNKDGSRFAIMTRNQGHWEVQVYDIQEGKWLSKRLSIPVENALLNKTNEAMVVLSLDNTYLAYRAGASALQVFNMKTGLQVFTTTDELENSAFTADSAYFVARLRRNLLFISTKDWGKPASLVLSAADTPFALAPDGKSVAVIFGPRLRTYAIDGLKSTREVALPASPKSWELSYLSDTVVQGYNIQWDGTQTLATVTIAEWDLESGQNTRLDTTETDSPSPFPPQWKKDLPLAASLGDLKAGKYNNFGFISDGMVLINSTHAVCWIKYITAEQSCVEDNDHVLFSSNTVTYKEVLEQYDTRLESWNGEPLLEISPYRIIAIDRSVQWFLVDLNGLGTDMYGKNRLLPEESVIGKYLSFAENKNLLAFTTELKSKTNVITIVDKATGNTLAQKKDIFLYKPMLFRKDGSLLLLKLDIDKKLIILNIMEPEKYEIRELKRLPLSSQVTLMVTSFNEDLFAFGMQDGSVIVFTPDFESSTTFQAFDSPLEALSFSLDGRYLAGASQDGVKVFAINP